MTAGMQSGRSDSKPTGGASELLPEQLLEAIREGQGHLAPLAVSFYARRLYRYVSVAFPYLSDLEQETVCELAVEKAVGKIAKFDPELGSFDAWLRAFVRYEVLNVLRSPYRESAVPWDVETDLGATAYAPTQPDHATKTVVAHAIASLTPEDQVIITLRTLERFDYDTIAETLGASAASCRQRHKRALQRLKVALPTSAVSLGFEVPRLETYAALETHASSSSLDLRPESDKSTSMSDLHSNGDPNE